MIDVFGNWTDLVAVGWFIANWLGYTRYVQRAGLRRRSLTLSLTLHRRHWMERLLARDNRITDASVIANLERNASFLASSALIIVAALLTAIAGSDEAVQLLASIPFAAGTSRELWETKALLLTMVFIFAFFQFTWAMRQYGFLSILVGAAPPPEEATDMQRRFAVHAAEVATLAAFAFNQGLRAYYFALAIIAWLINPVVFMVATSLVVWVLYRREFHSPAVRALHEALP
jgi:uncharacterized membrane protein